MSKERPQPTAPQPTMEEVLRRMLATPPHPHVAKKAPTKRKKK